MGGAVSAGKNNDELIDNLVEADFIKTPLVQQIFRAVDRGNYYADGHKENAYRDMAWRFGNLHLSAPCVYSEVMEALKLKSGLSFLNLGSGSGYLSTMAGLILGPYGINHGIELYSDVVDFAYNKLENFVKHSNAIDEFEFCEPMFMVGNCLMLDSSCQQYDRVYCGAACPEEHETYIKNLVKIGGILIMPLNDKLLKITRTGESTWQSVKVLSVSFAPLISPQPTKGPVCHIKLANFTPPTLQQLCRSQVRSILRQNIDKEHPNLKIKLRRIMERRQRRQVRRIVIPIFDESDIASNNSESNTDFENDSDSSPEYTISSRIPSRMSVLLEDFLRRHAEMQHLSAEMQHLSEMAEGHSQDNNSDSDSITDEKSSSRSNDKGQSTSDDKRKLRTDDKGQSTSDDKRKLRTDDKGQSTSSDAGKPKTDDKNQSSDDKSKPKPDDKGQSTSDGRRKSKTADKSQSKDKKTKPKSDDKVKTRSSGRSKSKNDNKRKRKQCDNTKPMNDESSSDDFMDTGEQSSHELLCSASFITLSSKKQSTSEPQPTTSRLPPRRTKRLRKRKKLDSDQSPSTSTGHASHSKVKFKRRAATVIWKRIVPKDSETEMDEDNEGKDKPEKDEENYTNLMITKIGDLPLPFILRRYINYRRDNM